MKNIQVMLVDDQSIIREGLRMILSLDDEIEIIGEACNGKEAIELVKNIKPDVILMDIRMPIMDGVKATEIIKERYPDIKIIILTTFNEDEYIFQGLKNGADGYILKDVKSDDIVKGIKTVYSGNVLLQPEIATKVVRALKIDSMNNRQEEITRNENSNNIIIKGRFEELTKREVEIALLVAKGKSNKEISRELFIAEGTVKNHLTRILDKLELENRTQLALYVNEKHD